MKTQIIPDTLYILDSDLSQAIDYYSEAKAEIGRLILLFNKMKLENSSLVVALYLLELDSMLKRDINSLEELKTLVRNARISFFVRSMFLPNPRVSNMTSFRSIINRVLSGANNEVSSLRNTFSSLNNPEGSYIIWGRLLKQIGRGKVLLENLYIVLDKLSELNNEDSIYELPEQVWGFVKDDELKNIIIRDYDELKRILRVQAPKSAIVLSGSILEAILVNIIRQNEDQGKQAFLRLFTKAVSIPPMHEWSLYQLILVGAELKILDEDTKRHIDIIREYRNLIHPMVEVRRSSGIDNEILVAQLSLLKRILRLLNNSKVSAS